MSLEDKIAALTGAVEALTGAVEMLGATLAAAPAAIPTAKPEAAPEKLAEEPAARGKAGGTKGTPVKTGPSADGKAGKAAAAAADGDGISAEELTKAIVKAVAATSKDQVVAMLKKDFGVGAGKEITDPVVRKEAADKLAALADEEDIA
jgi:hypothetical protein